MTVLLHRMEQRMPNVMKPGGGEKGVWPLDNPIIPYRPILYGVTLIHHSLLSHFTCTIRCCTLSWQAGREGVWSDCDHLICNTFNIIVSEASKRGSLVSKGTSTHFIVTSGWLCHCWVMWFIKTFWIISSTPFGSTLAKTMPVLYCDQVFLANLMGLERFI